MLTGRNLQFIQRYRGQEDQLAPDHHVVILNDGSDRKHHEESLRTIVFAMENWKVDQVIEKALVLAGAHGSMSGVYIDISHVFIFMDEES